MWISFARGRPRAQGHEGRHRPAGEQCSEGRPPQGEERAFGQELPRQLGPARAQGLANRHLAAPLGGPHQHQVGEVRARDQKQQRHRPQQHESAWRKLRVSSSR